MMLPMVLPVPRTSISAGTGPVCFLAHTGSASIASGLRVGAFPSKVTVPVMDEAATPTPCQTDTATSTAASRNPFAVPRMLGSLVIGHPVSVVPAATCYSMFANCARIASMGACAHTNIGVSRCV